MKAELTQQWKLLDLQKLDTRLTQIDYRLAHMPQDADIAKANKLADAAAEEMVLAQTAVSDVDREIARSEADVEQVRARIERNNARLEAGQGSAKDLQALQHELDTLRRRQGVLEDTEIEIMERAETLKERAEKFTRAADEAEAKVKEFKEAKAAQARELEAERSEVQQQRDSAAGGINADLLGEYDDIRARSGVAAGALHGRRCLGCGMELNSSDLAQLKKQPADTVLNCPECGRILVRTAESDL